MADSFTVTLVSNQSDDEFPNNTSSSFSNALPRTMDLSNYEVALQSLYVTDNFPRNVAVGEPVEPKKFFNLEEKENEISILTTNKSELRLQKQSDDFSAFIDRINQLTTFVRMPVVFTKTMTGNEVSKISFTYTPTPGYELIIHGDILRIMGFSRTRFEGGTYENDRPIDVAYFKSLAVGHVGQMTEFKETTTQVEVSQMKDKPDLELLMGFIVAALRNNLHDVRFFVDTDKATITYHVNNVSKRILFSSFLNKYLGLPDTFSFHNEGSIRVDRDILFPSKNKPPPSSCSKMLVLCDIIQPQIFAGKEMPILAVVDRKHTTEATEVTFEPRSLVYKPSQVGKVNHISISIQSDNNENIPHQQSPTVVNLHFRKMRDIQCDEVGSCKLVKMDTQQQQSSVPDDLIILERSPSRSPSPVIVKRKPIKAAPRGRAVSSKKQPVGRGRPRKPSKPIKKEVKRGRPPKPVKPTRGRPPIKQANKKSSRKK